MTYIPGVGGTPKESGTAAYRKCRIESCARNTTSGTTGLCAMHLSNHNRPGDGVRTGPKPKLTPEQVAEARRMVSAFKSKKEVANHFGVSYDTLRRYLNTPRGEQ